MNDTIENRIDNVEKCVDSVRERHISDNEMANILIEHVQRFQRLISERTMGLASINEGLSKLSWFNDVTPEITPRVKNLLDKVKDLHHTCIMEYVYLNDKKRRRLANTQIKAFKLQIDLLKERHEDVDDLFFNLPEDTEFNKEINALLGE